MPTIPKIITRTAGALALGAVLSVAGGASASPLSFSFDTGGSETPFTPFASAESGADFYSYGSPVGSSANVPFTLSSDRAHVYLHEDVTNGNISLGVILDAPGGGGGSATLDFSGLPSGTSVLQGDGESGDNIPLVSGSSYSADFGWLNCCTDGIVLGNFTNPFDINVSLLGDLQNLSGINEWAFYSGNSSEPTIAQLADPREFTLNVHARAVPEPAALGLFGIGLAGLGFAAWRRKTV